jgi:hypothetical protein
MAIHVRYQRSAIPKILAWRATLPGNTADRDGLFNHYVGIIAQEAVRRARKTKPPWDFTLNLSGTTQMRILVTKLKRGEYEALILDLV